MPRGGNPTQIDVNEQYQGFEYNYVFIISCAFVIWLIMPGIAFLYSGLTRRKSALMMLFQCLGVFAVWVSFSFPFYLLF